MYPLTLKSLGKTSVGCPRTTNKRELSFLKLLSRSSRDWSRNLQRRNESSYCQSDWLQPKDKWGGFTRNSSKPAFTIKLKVRMRNRKEELLFIPSLPTNVTRLLCQPALGHSYACSAWPDARALSFFFFFLLATPTLPMFSLRAVSTPWHLLLPHYITCMEKSINSFMGSVAQGILHEVERCPCTIFRKAMNYHKF